MVKPQSEGLIMNELSVSKAISSRASVRAFLDTPIPKPIVEEIITKAARAPSGGNVQPWQVHVLSGAALDDFRAIIKARLEKNDFDAAEYKVYPDSLWEPHKSYRFKVGADMYSILGIGRDDGLGRLKQFHDNYKFFGAPVALFFSLERRFNSPQWSDMGMFMQSIMLLSIEYGLDTCAQECWAIYHQSIRDFLGLDDGQIFFCAMALGYRDPDAQINKLATTRAPLADFATFRGFEE